jgi:DNA-binding transcriptional LysR family regulator
MTTVLQAFREHRPHVTLDLREDDPIKHLLLVRERDLDCAFVRLPETLDDELIAYPLVAVPTMVILPKGHRFGTRRVVRLRELADEDWVVLGRAIDDSFTADIVALCRSVGFMPHVAQETNDVRVLLGLVAAGLGIAIGTTAARDTYTASTSRRHRRASRCDTASSRVVTPTHRRSRRSSATSAAPRGLRERRERRERRD